MSNETRVISCKNGVTCYDCASLYPWALTKPIKKPTKEEFKTYVNTIYGKKRRK